MTEGGSVHVGSVGQGVSRVVGGEMGASATDQRELDPGSVVNVVRERFGLGQRLAGLLEVAASGCPTRGTSSGDGRSRGVFPLPFLSGRSESAPDILRAGARRKARHRHRGVSTCNFVIGILNLLFGGLTCLSAAVDARMGNAQLAAVKRVNRMSAGWDFTPEVTEVEALARQPVVDYALSESLQAAVDTVPELVKLPAQVGHASLLDLLPSDVAELYSCEDNVVAPEVSRDTDVEQRARARVFWSPSLRVEAVRDEFIKRMWDAGMLRVLQDVRERVGLFTVGRSDGLQRLVVDPRPTNAAWCPPPPIHLTSGPLLARQLQTNGRRGIVSKCDLSDYYYSII